jgi:hypothetical protein
MVCAKLRNGEVVTARKLRVELQDKLPHDFDPFHIDQRLLRAGDTVTLLGLALFDPTNDRVKRANQVIAAVYDFLNRFPNAEVVGVDDIAHAVSFSRVDVAVLFRELAEISHFHTSGSTYGHGIDGWQTIRVDKKTFGAYLRFRSLGQILDIFLDEQTLASSPAEANVQVFLQSIRRFKDGLTPFWIKAIEGRDLGGATDDLEAWKQRVVEYLRKQLSDVQAVEFQRTTKGFPLVRNVGDLDFRISRYEQWLDDLAKQVQQDPNMLASFRSKQTDSDDKKPKLEIGLEYAHSLYGKVKDLIDSSPNLDEAKARIIVEAADDAIKEFGSKHQEEKIHLKDWKRRAERVLPPETIEELRKRAEGSLLRGIFPRNKWLRTPFIFLVALIVLVLGLLTVKKTPLFGDSPLLLRESPTPSPQTQDSERRAELSVDKPTNIASPIVTPTQSPLSTESQGREELTIAEGSTESFFGGDVLISLIQTSLEGNPRRQKVFANVGSPSGRDFKIEQKDIGYSFYYNGKAKYQIRITGADTLYATFLIVRTS